MIPSVTFSRSLVAKYLRHSATIRREIGGVLTEIASGVPCSITKRQIQGPTSTNPGGRFAADDEIWDFAMTMTPDLEISDEVTVLLSDTGEVLGPFGVATMRDTGTKVSQRCRLSQRTVAVAEEFVTFLRFDQETELSTAYGPYPIRVVWGLVTELTGTGEAFGKQSGQALIYDPQANVEIGDIIPEIYASVVVEVGVPTTNPLPIVIRRDKGFAG